ncbi:GntR family transcriptional regulator [Massilia sp. CCM 8734]|uniref:GntR family transcriptional regulator n=1 Tax=Massilia sp. CCM 8734 TaxID=2609283 RepID=UPI001421788E|nr:GntR family transcriptional regulator [Massilia sp. CCM 8734]NHZ99604.1 FCD domain-containing protein [Massilia sp. CCM 8734]
MSSRSVILREKIEELIAVGALAPGQHLDETELAARFGVSRTPIRETLIQLSSMGLVVIRPRRGAVVAELGPHQLVEMFEVMSELEATCSRLAARRMTAADHVRLLAAHLACREARDASDPDAYYYKNEAFHEAIYAGSHNQFLLEQTRNLYRRLRPYRRLQLRVRDRVAASYEEHDGLVQAILAGDGDKAEKLTRSHVMIQGQRFADLMASLPQLAAGELLEPGAADGTQRGAAPIP